MARGGQEHLEPKAMGRRCPPSTGVTLWRSRPATRSLSHTMSSEVIKISFGIVDLI